MEDNTKTGLGEIRWGGGWIHLAQDRDQWQAVINTLTILRAL
jgi:hypothetical protein